LLQSRHGHPFEGCDVHAIPTYLRSTRVIYVRQHNPGSVQRLNLEPDALPALPQLTGDEADDRHRSGAQ